MSVPESGLARRRDTWILLAIALCSFVLRWVAVAQYEAAHPNAEHPVIDEASYDRWAREVASGEWLGREVFFQEPLYPYALGTLYALFGTDRSVARVAQAAAWALAALLCGLLARRSFGRAAGFVAAALLALYGPGLLFPSLLLKENLFLPLFAALALLVVRSRERESGGRAAWTWLAIGVLGGLGALLRGNLLVLLPCLVAWPLARAALERTRVLRELRQSLLVLVGAAIVLVPVAWRNHAVGGVFVLTTSGAGTNLYGGNNLENPRGVATEFSFVRGIPEFEAGDWRREAERRAGHALDPKQVSDFWRDQVFASVRAEPLKHAAILWNKLRLTLGSFEVPDNHFLPWDARYVPLARAPWPGFGVLGVLGLAGALSVCGTLARRKRVDIPCHAGAVELVMLFVLYLGTIVLTVTSDRARLPLVALLAPLGGWTLVSLWNAVRAPSRAALGWAAALTASALFVHWPVYSAVERAQQFDERDYNLAVQWRDEPGRETEARALATRLAATHPRSARIAMLAAELELRAIKPDLRANGEQRAAVERTLSSIVDRLRAFAADERLVARERFRADAMLGWIELDRSDWESAAKHFAAARTFDPDATELRRGEARAWLGLAESVPAQAGERIQAARVALEGLHAAVLPADEQREVELDLAQAEFQAGRRALGSQPDEARRAAAQSEFQAALKRLQPIAAGAEHSSAQRARARELAGWIQLELGNGKGAADHFQASLDFRPTVNARVGLLETAVRAAERASASESASLREAALQALTRAQSDGVPARLLDPLNARLAASR